MVSLDSATRHKIAGMVNQLCADFEGSLARPQIEHVMDDSVTRMLETAQVVDFVPLMAYRFARERLQALGRAGGHRADEALDVVFVSLSGGGRGQMAAALTTLLSEGRVSVHSAGTAARSDLDPGVRSVIAELGVDPDEAFARPVTDEVLQAANVIVTMGHSVGVIDIPLHARHEDWRVGDPIGAPLAEMRRVRGDIEHRVRTLLADLGIAVGGARGASVSA